ncbi:MAG TPA: Ig-like domain-containing protein, partial [Vicinamibacterales bacterium]|nr:Ig-like domain-containing protein [Vicinamibacterales bacterium]
MRRFVPPVPRRSWSYVRLLTASMVAIGLAITTISAQIPGRNVNMVAGTTFPDGDPYLQRQNEPSIAASTRNPLHLFAGANDYRTVDIPFDHPDETGDAWLGVFKSYDGGQRWTTTLLPGYPQDTTPVGKSSPIYGYGAGADAVVRAGTNGLIYYAGLAFDRADKLTPDIPGKSAIFVARYIDNNNKETGDTFEYLGTRALATSPGGPGGSFLDKPWMVVDVPRDGARCTIVTAGEKGPITQNIPAGPVYVAYTIRTTDSKGPRYDVYFTRSTDCAATWATPVRLNSTSERGNQGATMAIDPRNGTVHIAWRQFDVSDNDSGTDALMAVSYIPSGNRVTSPGFARKFAKAKKGKGKGLNLEHFYKKGGVAKALEAAELSPLDQSTSAALIRFRTNAYPSLVVDETGRVYMAWSERGYDPLSPDPVLGAARVLVATSTTGQTWTAPVPVASGEIDPVTKQPQKGHQLMPALTYAGGKLMLVYYDVRETRSKAFTQWIDDRTAFTKPGDESTGLRHTIDLRASMASPGATPAFGASVKVSEYIEGPRVPKGPNVPLQVNPPNLPMFQKGTAPFIGDYIDITAAPNFIVDQSGKWTYNTTAGATPPIFHAVWTDNRDVRVPLEDPDQNGNPWDNYAPPGTLGGSDSLFDPSMKVPQCIPGNAGSRNQNVYTSRITGGLLAGSPGNTKRLGERRDENGNTLGELLQRSFVVFAQNTTDQLRRFRFTIVNQPIGGSASFDQFSSAPLTAVEADIPYRSTASRTVYAKSTDPHAMITVNVQELELVNGSWAVKPAGLASAVILNPDIDNPDIDNPDIDNPDIDNPDIDNAEVMNPDIDNPDIDNPDIDNPDIDNPDIDNPDIDNVEVANPDIDNPDIDNPDIDNPDIDNPDIDNPDIDNPDIDNTSLMTDVTWTMTNTGNTTATYNVNLFFAQQTFDPTIKTQLILYRTYKTPVVKNCELKTETRNVLVANVPDPQLVYTNTGGLSNPNDSAATNATIYLAPGESARITLRVFDPTPDNVVIVRNPDGTPVLNDDGSPVRISSQFVPNEDVTPVVQQQGVNTEDVIEGVVEPPAIVQFPPPQAVPDGAATAELTPVTVNVLANDSTAFGSTKIISFHPAGMASHSGGGPGDITYQPSTGYLYTQRGIVDPATNALVGRLGLPPIGAGVAYQQANPRTGINYQRSGTPTAALSALDARPDSPTFHQYLPMPALPDGVFTFGMDTVRGRLYVLHGEQTQSPTSRLWFSVIDINPANETFHTVLSTVAMPAGLRGNSVAVNTRTQKIYLGIGANLGSANTGGVYVVDGATAPPLPTRVPNTFFAGAVAVNESSNQIFAQSNATVGGQPNQFVLNAIDGATLAVATIQTQLPNRFSNADERLAVHEGSGKVFMRLGNAVVVIDGKKGSPSRNSVLAVIPVGADANNADIAIDQQLGRVITTGAFDFRADIIDVATHALLGTVPLRAAAADVAIDPVRHVAFVSTTLTSVVKIDLTGVEQPVTIPVFIEAGGPIVNPVTNKAYIGGTATNTGIGIVSGSGLMGEVALATNGGRVNFSVRQNSTNRYFFANQANQSGTSSAPGTVIVVDGATDTAIKYLSTLPQPFGIGFNQVAQKLYVASMPGDTAHGGLRVFDATNLDAPGVDATFTTDAAGFPLNNPNAFIGFNRFVVPNPSDGRVYALVSGGSPSSLAVYNPLTNTLTPLDGRAGTPLFDHQAAAGQSWGRANIIRVNATRNQILVGFDNGATNRIVVLDGATLQVQHNIVAGKHSNRHTASYIQIDEALDRVFVSDYANGTVTMFDAGSFAVASTINVGFGPSAQALNLTAKRLYVSSIDAKTLTAINYTTATMSAASSVRMPLVAYFLVVDEIESRIYTSGGDSMDESGAMVVTDILGQLGTDVSVTGHSSAANGTVTLNADYSLTYRPAFGFAGIDSFTYTIQAPTGTAQGVVTINVAPSNPTLVSFADAYSAAVNQALSVPAPGPLANDATGSTLTTMVIDSTTTNGQLTAQPDGSFVYVPNDNFAGTDSFTYHAVTAVGASNIATVTISVAQPNDVVVTNTNDSGAGSLRNAIGIANVEPNTVIRFNIPGAGPHTIAPTTPLPALTQPTTIDGYTQPGSSTNTDTVGTNAVIKIELNGSSAGSNATGLLLQGGNSTIRGLAIGGFSSAGIAMEIAGNNRIEGNFIGTNAGGTTAVPNGAAPVAPSTSPSGVGVASRSPNNFIGTEGPAGRNLISGNLATGVRVERGSSGSNGAGTVIVNNLIGTNATGNGAMPNGQLSPLRGEGVLVTVPNVTIGGTSAASRNVISGNNGHGINTFGQTQNGANPPVVLTTPANLTVAGNYIGVTANGTAALGNRNNGVFVTGANSNVTGNVVSGNFTIGVHVGTAFDTATTPIVTSTAEGTVVEGNSIGTNATGTAGVANFNDGLRITASNVRVGGTAVAQRNIIAGNSQAGISIGAALYPGAATAATTGANAIVIGNYIGMNAAGTSALSQFIGIAVTAPNVRIGGVTAGERNVIAGTIDSGITATAATFGTGSNITVVSTGNNLLVQGNYIGVGPDGVTPRPNGNGVHINAPNATVGGNVPGAGNVIAGNNAHGITIGSAFANGFPGMPPPANAGQVYSKGTNAKVLGNFIGTDPTGAQSIPNSTGVQVSAEDAQIGDGTIGGRNVISGNREYGISFNVAWESSTNAVISSGARGTVRGNHIGVDASGGNGLGNMGGIVLGVPDVKIGGPGAADRNVISANTREGIATYVARVDSTVLARPSGLIVEGNFIGTNAAGSAPLGNGMGGVRVVGANSRVGGAAGTTPSGACTGSCNLIAGNSGNGISIGAEFDNSVASNGAIFSSAAGTIVEGNAIGVSVNGLSAIANSGDGVFVTVPATIGSGSAAARNVIAGNGGVGIRFSNDFVNHSSAPAYNTRISEAAGSVARGNYIGVNSAGTQLLVNNSGGIYAASAGITIGGSSAADGNVVAANHGANPAIGLHRHINGSAVISDGGSSIVQNNIVGLTANMAARLNGASQAVRIYTAANQILQNVIAGNGAAGGNTPGGIEVFSALAANNVIRGNYVGTTPAGVTGLGNRGWGIHINDASGTIIGGNNAADRNVITGNDFGAISVTTSPGGAANNTSIRGNYIGVLPDGVTTHGNAVGIMVSASAGTTVNGTTIGGSTPGDRNVIAGNNFNGIGLYNAGVSNTAIRGNYIGVAADGVTSRPNTAAGVWISGSHDNVVGGTNPNEGNLIAFNVQVGVGLNAGSVRNAILSNRIHSNNGMGIDLRGNNAIEPNDNGDGDSGENMLQNFPVLTSADNSGNTTVVNVDISSFAVGTYTVQVFANAFCDGTHGEGARLVGTGMIVQPGGSITLDELVSMNELLTATATDGSGNTSEFSACLSMAAPPSTTVTNTNDSGAGSLRAAITNANNQPGSQTITFAIPGVLPTTPAVINLTSPLPIITGPVVIDAASQQGYDGTPVIELDGQNAIANGFETAPDVALVTIQGFMITRFTNAGIFLMQADTSPAGNIVTGNYIGLHRSGAAKPNGTGVLVRTDHSSIANNVISGN